jgi:Plasma-membrane choline transporter.
VVIVSDIIANIQTFSIHFYHQAFIYVGVYGYPYLAAGKKVMTLFEQRGWTVVINDNLVSNALGLMGFIIAVLSLFFSSFILGTANASFLVVG